LFKNDIGIGLDQLRTAHTVGENSYWPGRRSYVSVCTVYICYERQDPFVIK